VANQLGIAVERFHLRQRAEQLAVLEERNRLARELHDSVTQSLYSAVLFVEASRRMIEAGKPDKAALYLTDVSETSQQALKEMRLLVHKLRPSALEREGLLFALEQRLKAVEGRVGIQYQLLADEKLRLTPDLEESLYHISQEALNNALKHARASKVAVRLQQQEGEVTLWVMDNGKGFDVTAAGTAGGLGLTTMREWAALFDGTVTVQSTPEEGTLVVARLKLPGIGEQR
jgi:signal transduction histidine kinase